MASHDSHGGQRPVSTSRFSFQLTSFAIGIAAGLAVYFATAQLGGSAATEAAVTVASGPTAHLRPQGAGASSVVQAGSVLPAPSGLREDAAASEDDDSEGPGAADGAADDDGTDAAPAPADGTVANMGVDTPPCTWPARYRPLYGEEWLDRQTQSVSLPLLGSQMMTYITNRPGHSYNHEFWTTYSDGTWEPKTFVILKSVLSARRGVYVDIGAWIGPTVLYAAHIAERVYALEPDPRAFSELHANVRLNPSVAQKVTLFRHCISATSGTVTMTGPAPLGSSMSRVAGVAAIPEQAQKERHWGDRMVSYPADCSSVADWAADVALSPRDVSLVKIDTEGAEVAVLASLLAWLREAPRAEWPPLFVSLHPGFWSDPDGRAWSRIMDVVKEYPVVLRKQGNVMVTINTESGNACSDLCELLCSDTPLVAA